MPPGNRPKGPDYSQAVSRRLSRVTSRTQRQPNEDEPGFNPTTMGNRRQGMVQTQRQVSRGGRNVGAKTYPGDNTRAVPGDHIGVTELASDATFSKKGKYAKPDMADAINRRLSKSSSAR